VINRVLHEFSFDAHLDRKILNKLDPERLEIDPKKHPFKIALKNVFMKIDSPEVVEERVGQGVFVRVKDRIQKEEADKETQRVEREKRREAIKRMRMEESPGKRKNEEVGKKLPRKQTMENGEMLVRKPTMVLERKGTSVLDDMTNSQNVLNRSPGRDKKGNVQNVESFMKNYNLEDIDDKNSITAQTFKQSDIGDFFSRDASNKIKADLYSPNAKQDKTIVNADKSKYENQISSFTTLMEGKLDLPAMLASSLNKISSPSLTNRSKAKAVFLESFKEVFLPLDDLNIVINDTLASYREVYLKLLPTVLKLKHAGDLKEKERMQSEELKIDAAQWEFKLMNMHSNYKVKIASLSGRLNTIVEQIFEVLHTFTLPVISLIESYNDLTTSARLLGFVRDHIGGANSDYIVSLCLQMIEPRMEKVAEFFFDKYLTIILGYFTTDPTMLIQAFRREAITCPDVHIFLNCFRILMNQPEVRNYSYRTIEALGKLYLSLKNDKPHTFKVDDDKIRLRSSLQQKLLSTTETLKEVMKILDFSLFMASWENYPYLKVTFEKVLMKAAKLIDKERNGPQQM
jgi:hypothetical protein